jgi:phage-related protein
MHQIAIIIKTDKIKRKPIVWVGDSRGVMRLFAPTVRQRAGRELARTQEKLEPNDWKPMPAIGLGVCEIRVHAEGEHRVIYLAKFSEAIYVLHAFEKKSQRTPKTDIEIARRRFRVVVASRKVP